MDDYFADPQDRERWRAFIKALLLAPPDCAPADVQVLMDRIIAGERPEHPKTHQPVVVDLESPMSAEEFQRITSALGGVASSARWLGIHITTVQKYRSGEHPVWMRVAKRARILHALGVPSLRRGAGGPRCR